MPRGCRICFRQQSPHGLLPPYRHFKAIRALANRWLEILHHLLVTGQRYDEAVHQRNRAKAPRPAAA